MSAVAEKPSPAAGNGARQEPESYMRLPEEKSKWESFRDAIYNSQERTFLGRTRKSWCTVTLFYLVFYIVLAALCAVCGMGLMATLDKHRPKYTLDSSIIGTNPGLGFRPLSEAVEEGSLIWYTTTNTTQIKKWISRVDNFLTNYLNKTNLPNDGRNQVICDYDKPPKEGKVCAIELENWGPCSPAQSYGFNNSSPCIFIKLNRIYDWTPTYYNETENLPEEMPESLKQHIKQIDKSKLNTVWVSCEGEYPADREAIGDLEYFPLSQGFPGYYYPYRNHLEYLSPIVAVHFKRPQRNRIINVECRAWAKNIIYSSDKGEKKGAVHFELMIDD